MWDAFQWRSGAEMQYLRSFALSIGKRYQDLVPDEWVTPSKTPTVLGYEGWAWAARTADGAIFLAYFEKGCPTGKVRGARPTSLYTAQWFDPRNGSFVDAAGTPLASNNIGEIRLPAFPGDNDWGLKLVYAGPAPRPAHF
jgi:hypothetical protein